MPSDLVLYEDELQGVVERTVLAIQNARARLAKTTVPILTGDFEVQFSGILLKRNGALNSIDRTVETNAPGGTQKTTTVEPAQKTVTTQAAEQTDETGSNTQKDNGSTTKGEIASDDTTRSQDSTDESTESTEGTTRNAQDFGRSTEQTTEYLE